MIAIHPAPLWTASIPCSHCAVLEERIAFLQSELGYQRDAKRSHALITGLGITPKAAMILMTLYSAYPSPVMRYQLENCTLAPGEEEEERTYGYNLVTVYVSRLRKRLGPEGIEMVRNKGYRLSESGWRQVQTALGDVG